MTENPLHVQTREAGAPKAHCTEVDALLRELRELELADQPFQPTEDPLPEPEQKPQRYRHNTNASTDRVASPRNGLPKMKSSQQRSTTISKQAYELEVLREAARQAEEYERRYQDMRKALRRDVMVDCFGEDTAEVATEVEIVPVDLLAEIDYSLSSFEFLSQLDVSLDACVDQFRGSALWQNMCGRCSPPFPIPVAAAPVKPTIKSSQESSASSRAPAAAKTEEVVIAPATVPPPAQDDAPSVPQPPVAERFCPATLPRDEGLAAAYDELKILGEEEDKAAVSKIRRTQSLIALQENSVNRELAAALVVSESADELASTQPAHAQEEAVGPPLLIDVQPTTFAEAPPLRLMPQQPSVEAVDDEAVDEAEIEAMRARSRRNLSQMAHLRALATVDKTK